jgi:hypothetical protein
MVSLEIKETTMPAVLDNEDASLASRLINLLHEIESATPAIRTVDNDLAATLSNAGSAIRKKLGDLGLGPAI